MTKHRTTLLAAALGLVCVTTSVFACDAVVQKKFLLLRDFYNPATFGSLGLKLQGGRLLVLDQASCYDLAGAGLGNLSIYFNFATDVSERDRTPTYLAVQVISEMPSRRGPPQLSMERNPNSEHAGRGKWAHPRGDEDLQSNPDQYRPDQLDFAGGYDSQFDTDRDRKDFSAFVGRPEAPPNYKGFRDKFGKWHALLVTNETPRRDAATGAPEASPNQRPFRVVRNTWTDRAIWQVPDEELSGLVKQNSFRIRQHLISFKPFTRNGSSQENPNYHVSFQVGTNQVSCVYVRVSVPESWANSFAIRNLIVQRFIALRIQPGAQCAGARPDGWLDAAYRFWGPRSAIAAPSR
jgi:hypothetical protein